MRYRRFRILLNSWILVIQKVGGMCLMKCQSSIRFRYIPGWEVRISPVPIPMMRGISYSSLISLTVPCRNNGWQKIITHQRHRKSQIIQKYNKLLPSCHKHFPVRKLPSKMHTSTSIITCVCNSWEKRPWTYSPIKGIRRL